MLLQLIACLSWPKALKVHQTRGALNMPCVSYTTTAVSFRMFSASAAAANAACAPQASLSSQQN